MPRLFREPDSIPGLTWPTLTFSDRLTIPLGGDRGDLVLQYCGRGHTAGDIVAWLPDQRILFAGDLVEAQAALYTGDAFHVDWATGTLDAVHALGAETLVGGRGAVAHGRDAVDAAVAQTRNFLVVMRGTGGAVHAGGGTFREAFQQVHAALAPTYGALADLRAQPAVQRAAALGRVLEGSKGGRKRRMMLLYVPPPHEFSPSNGGNVRPSPPSSSRAQCTPRRSA